MAYGDLAGFLRYVNELSGSAQNALNAAQSAVAQQLLDQAQAEMERVTGRRFEAATETRTYGPEDVDGPTLRLDEELLTLTGLVDGSGAAIALDVTTLEPRNAAAKSRITLKTGKWNEDSGDVRVSGVWGHCQTPSPDAVRVLYRLAWFYWQKKRSTGETQLIDGRVANVASEYPADIRKWLESNKKRMVR